jgi:hypothetical protein
MSVYVPVKLRRQLRDKFPAQSFGVPPGFVIRPAPMCLSYFAARKEN